MHRQYLENMLKSSVIREKITLDTSHRQQRPSEEAEAAVKAAYIQAKDDTNIFIKEAWDVKSGKTFAYRLQPLVRVD